MPRIAAGLIANLSHSARSYKSERLPPVPSRSGKAAETWRIEADQRQGDQAPQKTARKSFICATPPLEQCAPNLLLRPPPEAGRRIASRRSLFRLCREFTDQRGAQAIEISSGWAIRCACEDDSPRRFERILLFGKASLCRARCTASHRRAFLRPGICPSAVNMARLAGRRQRQQHGDNQRQFRQGALSDFPHSTSATTSSPAGQCIRRRQSGQ